VDDKCDYASITHCSIVSCSVTDRQTDRQTDLLDEVEDSGKSLMPDAARLVDCKHKVDDVAAA